MNRSESSNPIRSLWDRTARLPMGRTIFGFLIGRAARYTGSIRPRVLELRSGYARVEMRDRPAVRNHLRSVHAIALMNLAEVATGLALHHSLPDHARAILTGLQIEYLKKARGTLTAEATAPVPDGETREEIVLTTEVRDGAGDVVARASAKWLVGPREEKGSGEVSGGGPGSLR
jgi:acyl-coenzyme A thioesterase PaaI-like protein